MLYDIIILYKKHLICNGKGRLNVNIQHQRHENDNDVASAIFQRYFYNTTVCIYMANNTGKYL